ncbi:MAG: hypothetical protein GXY83_36910 [Rhodopirellula sp.]|nr:hypothetical protein [Rhodopirellula sp.]
MTVARPSKVLPLGTHLAATSLCPCGSGQKFMRCCGG